MLCGMIFAMSLGSTLTLPLFRHRAKKKKKFLIALLSIVGFLLLPSFEYELCKNSRIISHCSVECKMHPDCGFSSRFDCSRFAFFAVAHHLPVA